MNMDSNQKLSKKQRPVINNIEFIYNSWFQDDDSNDVEEGSGPEARNAHRPNPGGGEREPRQVLVSRLRRRRK